MPVAPRLKATLKPIFFLTPEASQSVPKGENAAAEHEDLDACLDGDFSLPVAVSAYQDRGL